MTKVLPVANEFWELGKKTLVMGILNTTPDSFTDGGKYFTMEAAVARALEIQKEGAAILDIGGMSTRPGAEIISVEEEIKRVLPVIKALKESGKLTIPMSIDTYRSQVARVAVEAGASLINDVTGGMGLAHPFFIFSSLLLVFTPRSFAVTPKCSRLWPNWTCQCVSCICAGIPRP